MTTDPDAARPFRRGRRIGTAIGIVCWVIAPFALVASLTWASAHLTVDGDTAPAWVAADESGRDLRRQIAVGITWEESNAVVAPAWSGTVREVLVGPGGSVASGDIVLRVDAVARVVWHSSAPFYRALGAGSTGDDVAALNQMLAGLGLEHAEADRFTDATRNGVRALAQRLGAGTASVFLPEWVVYLPAEKVEVAGLEITVGEPAPSAGSALLTLAPTATTAWLEPEDTGMLGDDSTVPEILADEVLVVGDTQIELADDQRTLSAEGLATLAALVDPGTESVTGSLVRQVHAEAVEIPAAAVHTDATGSSCVRVRTGGTETTIAVTVLAGSAGRSVVSGELAPGDEVGIAAIEPSEPCG